MVKGRRGADRSHGGRGARATPTSDRRACHAHPRARRAYRGRRSKTAQIAADAVIANADPKRTFLQLVDPVDLDPEFTAKVRNYRTPGMVAKLDFALSALFVPRHPRA
jgi:hypothetical protein